MHHFSIGRDLIDFVVDDSPLKQGLFTPGLHVPVLSPDAIRTRSPDLLVILAWNFAEPIMRKQHRFVERGGRFILPLPEVAVLPEEDEVDLTDEEFSDADDEPIALEE